MGLAPVLMVRPAAARAGARLAAFPGFRPGAGRAVDLAEKAGVHISTIQRSENASGPLPMMPANAKAVRAALEAAGVEFTNGDAPGVRLRKPGDR
jgi:hypothetical protein